MSGWAEPMGPGAVPVASAIADCQKVSTMPASNSEVSTLWPLPVFCRSKAAGRMPMAPRMPAVMSVTGAPILTGGRPGPSPVMLISPLMPWAIRSKPPRVA